MLACGARIMVDDKADLAYTRVGLHIFKSLSGRRMNGEVRSTLDAFTCGIGGLLVALCTRSHVIPPLIGYT